MVIPLIINAINRKRENENKRFDENKELYLELSELLIQILSKDEIIEDNRRRFKDYIVSNYHYMCLNFSSKLISLIYRTYRAYLNNQTENVKSYSNK